MNIGDVAGDFMLGVVMVGAAWAINNQSNVPQGSFKEFLLGTATVVGTIFIILSILAGCVMILSQ